MMTRWMDPKTEQALADLWRRDNHRAVRDSFAAAALTGMLANPNIDPEVFKVEEIAHAAWKFGEAMLAEREKLDRGEVE